MVKDEKSAVVQRYNDNFEVVRRLSAKQLENERTLYETKWFDYRFMSPLQATRFFAEAYTKAYRDQYARETDTAEAANKTGTRARNWESSRREFTSFWAARQFADTLGVPYDFFLSRAMKVLLRRGYTRIPRPNQLYAGKTLPLIANDVVLEWTSWTSTGRLVISDLPQYHIDQHRGFAAQSAHQKWVVEQVKAWHSRYSHIAQMCFERAVLSVGQAKLEFGAEKVQRAHEEAELSGYVRRPKSEMNRGQFMPSCFGLPNARNDAAATCSACPLSRGCASLAGKIETRARHVFGTTDPKSARRKELQRNRTRRCRARKAAAARRRVTNSTPEERKCADDG